MAVVKRGVAITSLQHWKEESGPKRDNQWKEGRSALEVARAWLTAGDHLPDEVLTALRQHPAFGEVTDWQGEPEVPLRFDGFRGEPRNSDLVVHTRDDHGEVLLAIEAKADEPFGETTADALAAALDRLLTNPRSNGLRRIQQLAAAILGQRQKYDVPLKDIRYQLLTATAGAICEAERRRVGRVVLLIQEFITDKTKAKKHLANEVDLDLFVRRASHGMYCKVSSGEIVGPIQLPGKPLFSDSVKFYVAKVSRNIRTLQLPLASPLPAP
ncbi:MAG TPA: hypothetical protein VM165_04390 [Planctomycetaceae bacterium]|nr:hypothetical protein [Planctomycetaceae bacterium]